MATDTQEQTRERISEVESVYTRVKWSFIVCIILALIFVCISYPDIERFFDRTPDPVWLGPPVRREDILMDVLGIPLFLLFPFIFLLKSKAGVEVEGGVQAFFLFGAAVVAECCGIFLDDDRFAVYAYFMLLTGVPVVTLSYTLDGYCDDGEKWAVVMACMVVAALIIYFSHDKSPVNSFDLWVYVITAFGATIFVAWRFKIACVEESDRLRELICEYEKKIKEKKAFEDRKKGYAYESILAKKARLEEELRAREEQIAEMYEEGSDPEWETPAFQPEEELSDEEKLKRAIDRFRIPSPQAEDEFFSPFGG